MELVVAFLSFGGVGVIPELVKYGHGFTPVGHCAVRIFGGDVLEAVLGLRVLEGVHERDGMFKGFLDVGRAGGGEDDGAECFGGVVMVVGIG